MQQLTERRQSVQAVPMPSLPPRVVALASAACSTETRRGTIWHLPAGWAAIDERDRADARRAVSTFEALLNPDVQYDKRTAAQARLGMITMLVAGTATGASGEEGAGAKLDLFEMALSDIPAWAIARAISRWIKREVPTSIEKAPNYAFTPPPQTIRELAKLEMAYAERALREARKVAGIVTAEEALEFSRPTGETP